MIFLWPTIIIWLACTRFCCGGKTPTIRPSGRTWWTS
nr:MAG TPA: Prominin [Caudoviricetes sp.]